MPAAAISFVVAAGLLEFGGGIVPTPPALGSSSYERRTRFSADGDVHQKLTVSRTLQGKLIVVQVCVFSVDGQSATAWRQIITCFRPALSSKSHRKAM